MEKNIKRSKLLGIAFCWEIKKETNNKVSKWLPRNTWPSLWLLFQICKNLWMFLKEKKRRRIGSVAPNSLGTAPSCFSLRTNMDYSCHLFSEGKYVIKETCEIASKLLLASAIIICLIFSVFFKSKCNLSSLET